MATVKKMSGTVEVSEAEVVEAEVVEAMVSNTDEKMEGIVKYRKDFDSWEEYNNYTGPKA
jgi:hypothetical protein